MTWFNALIAGAVLVILIIAGGRALSDADSFSPMELSGAVAMLLVLPVFAKLAGRRKPDPKRRK